MVIFHHAEWAMLDTQRTAIVIGKWHGALGVVNESRAAVRQGFCDLVNRIRQAFLDADVAVFAVITDTAVLIFLRNRNDDSALMQLIVKSGLDLAVLMLIEGTNLDAHRATVIFRKVGKATGIVYYRDQAIVRVMDRLNIKSICRTVSDTSPASLAKIENP